MCVLCVCVRVCVCVCVCVFVRVLCMHAGMRDWVVGVYAGMCIGEGVRQGRIHN